ncbi:MAG: hypothetical protein H6711_34600 [Myxococcales bacterium]|nr:hypothetical protein [Myxococcales bacterium]
MTDSSDSIRDLLHKGLGDLRTMRDEIKLKLHLAGMDAKQAWEALEPRLGELEKQASEVSEATVEAAQKAAGELQSAFAELRKKLG